MWIFLRNFSNGKKIIQVFFFLKKLYLFCVIRNELMEGLERDINFHRKIIPQDLNLTVEHGFYILISVSPNG